MSSLGRVQLPARGLRRRVVGLPTVGAAVLLAGALAGCSAERSAAPDDQRAASTGSAASIPEPDPVRIDSNVRPNARRVPVDTTVEIEVTGGQLTAVTAVGVGEGRVPLPGRIAPDGGSWTATELLEPGSSYTVTTVARAGDGAEVTQRRLFRTVNLSLDRQTFPSIAPLQGETVGVGMPVVVQFDVPVRDRAAIEQRLRVTASKPVTGAWHWFSNREVHYRPRRFWEPGTKVTVDADINGVHAGNGVYGQLDRRVRFRVGSSVVSKVYIQRHVMEVFINGSLARTIPVTTGKPGFETRRGTKVVMEKFVEKHMDAATTGISPGDPEYYNITNVPYALRVTHSGEFLHGAPWSSGSQGAANVSHGCVGMSVDDARWLFDQTTRGDVVRVFGSDRGLEPGNGWTDWDITFAEYAKGSALAS